MLDPSLKWIGALDGHYHDQAQFVREFREFMGMTPRQYGGLDHPIIEGIMNERARLAGRRCRRSIRLTVSGAADAEAEGAT
jgi:AraC-like DNA-binding protein